MLPPVLARLRELGDRRALGRRRRKVRVDRDARDEGVVANVGEGGECALDDARDIAARVDDRVERATGERVETPVPVTAKLLDS